jgi:hypothetical protein
LQTVKCRVNIRNVYKLYVSRNVVFGAKVEDFLRFAYAADIRAGKTFASVHEIESAYRQRLGR